MRYYDKLIFELSKPGRCAFSLPSAVGGKGLSGIPASLMRAEEPLLPQVSEVDVVRHYTNLSQMNFGVDTGFYPLGSCTMKYNPKINEEIAGMDAWAGLHPLQSSCTVQGALEVYYEMDKALAAITGMKHFTFAPCAGAHGELTGLMIMRSYHMHRGDVARTKVIVPDSAHGTNPASAAVCGLEIVEVKSNSHGLVDVEDLKPLLGPDIAGIMMTNPNTLGLFEKDIKEIAALVHSCGGLLYYDGANMNPLLGAVRPGDMGFDIMHLNLHKTFSTPHGGGGPGSGPVGVCEMLARHLPSPTVIKDADGKFRIDNGCGLAASITSFTAAAASASASAADTAFAADAASASDTASDTASAAAAAAASDTAAASASDTAAASASAGQGADDCGLSVSAGQVSGFMGNFGVILRAYAYILMLGKQNIKMAGRLATLGANYIKESLKDAYKLPIPSICKHEFVFDGLTDDGSSTGKPGATTLDVAKRLLDFGYHAPTIYFPLLFHQALMIEPTETESKETLDAFIDVMHTIAEEAAQDPDILHKAPHNAPISRPDETTAARKPILKFQDQ